MVLKTSTSLQTGEEQENTSSELDYNFKGRHFDDPFFVSALIIGV
jgi:hypothetical protein